MAVVSRSWFQTADTAIGLSLRTIAFKPYAAAFLLVLLCCALYLPGIATLPVTDRDEARFAQATKQMLETGDYINIWFQDAPRHKKPIGIYWLQSVSVSLAAKFGAALNDIWAYRIPSFLGALSAVLLTFWAARAVIGREAGLIAAALFASCLTLSFESRIAKSDAALIGSLMLMQGALFRLYLAPFGSATRWLAAMFWAGMGIGILIKGPIAPALAVFTAAPVLLFDNGRGWLRNLHWHWGVPLLLAITLPWFIAIGISSGGAFFQSSLGQDFAGKIQSGQEKHWGPPGFYFILFWWTFWPAMLFVTWGAVRAIWQLRRSRRVLFLLAWVIPFWLMIEAIPTKLPHYALPLYAAFAIAAAMVLRSAAFAQDRKMYRWGSILWGFIAALQITAIVAVSWFFSAEVRFAVILLIMGLAAFASITFLAARSGYMNLAVVAAVLSGVVFYSAAFRYAVPALRPVWFSQDTAFAANSLKACGTGPYVFAGFSEPSAVFYNGTQTLFTSSPNAADQLASGRFGLAFVAARNRQAFEDRYQQASGTPAAALGCVDGLNINGRGPTRLHVYARPGNSNCAPATETQCISKNSVRWRRLLDTPF